MKRLFHQVDVFSAVPLKGNLLAVVHAAEGLDEATIGGDLVCCVADQVGLPAPGAGE